MVHKLSIKASIINKTCLFKNRRTSIAIRSFVLLSRRFKALSIAREVSNTNILQMSKVIYTRVPNHKALNRSNWELAQLKCPKPPGKLLLDLNWKVLKLDWELWLKGIATSKALNCTIQIKSQLLSRIGMLLQSHHQTSWAPKQSKATITSFNLWSPCRTRNNSD